MNDLYVGFGVLEDDLIGEMISRASSGAPVDADSFPTFRVYGPLGLVLDGTSEYADNGTVTGATNANPIVITSTAHGLTNGVRVTLTGVGGNTAANTTATVSAVTANTFTLTGVAGNGAYTSGGEWHVTGLYKYEIELTQANGFASGQNYFVLFSYAVSATAQGVLHSFMVG